MFILHKDSKINHKSNQGNSIQMSSAPQSANDYYRQPNDYQQNSSAYYNQQYYQDSSNYDYSNYAMSYQTQPNISNMNSVPNVSNVNNMNSMEKNFNNHFQNANLLSNQVEDHGDDGQKN